MAGQRAGHTTPPAPTPHPHSNRAQSSTLNRDTPPNPYVP